MNLDMEIKSLKDFLTNVTRQQDDKIEMYKQQIEDNKKVIRRQDKLIVDLQQKNEVSQNAVSVTQECVSTTIGKKDKLEMKLRELNDQRQHFHGSIGTMENKIGT